jgi:hypothetical protein
MQITQLEAVAAGALIMGLFQLVWYFIRTGVFEKKSTSTAASSKYGIPQNGFWLNLEKKIDHIVFDSGEIKSSVSTITQRQFSLEDKVCENKEMIDNHERMLTQIRIRHEINHREEIK